MNTLQIDFVSDVSCPWCAVGLGALEQALQNLQGSVAADITFQPFELNPQMGPEGQDIGEHLTQKYGSTPEQQTQIRDTIRARGAEVGGWDTALDLCAAFVGHGAASAFRSFAKTSGLPSPRDLLEGSDSYQYDRARADLARAVLLGCSTEAIHGDVATAADRERLVEAAWSQVLAACDAGLSEATPDAAKALATWRRDDSGQPLKKGADEAEACRRLAKVIAPAKKALGKI